MYVKCKCRVFTNIKQTLHYNRRDVYFLCIVFSVVALDSFFFVWGPKKVVAGRVKQVVNDCMRIGLGGLSTGVLQR